MDLAFANAFDILNECDWFRRLVTLQKVRAPLPAFCNWVRSVSASSLFSDLPEIPKRLAGPTGGIALVFSRSHRKAPSWLLFLRTFLSRDSFVPGHDPAIRTTGSGKNT